VVGGYTDFLRELKSSTSLKPIFGDEELQEAKSKSNGNALSKTQQAVAASTNSRPANKSANKRSYKIQKELDELPERINQLELKIAGFHEIISSAGFYDNKENADKVLQDSKTAQDELDAAYARWEELESQ